MSVVRFYYAQKAARQGQSFGLDKQAVRNEGPVLLAIRFGGFLLLLAVIGLYLFEPSWMTWAQLPLPSALRWLGAALAAPMIPGMVWVLRTLGRHFTTNLSLRGDHQIVTAGPYARIRHPLYSVLFIFIGGITLVSADLRIAAVCAVAVAFIAGRIPREEAMMLERFGDGYRQYMSRTGRLLPRL